MWMFRWKCLETSMMPLRAFLFPACYLCLLLHQTFYLLKIFWDQGLRMFVYSLLFLKSNFSSFLYNLKQIVSAQCFIIEGNICILDRSSLVIWLFSDPVPNLQPFSLLQSSSSQVTSFTLTRCCSPCVHLSSCGLYFFTSFHSLQETASWECRSCSLFGAHRSLCVASFIPSFKPSTFLKWSLLILN